MLIHVCTCVCNLYMTYYYYAEMSGLMLLRRKTTVTGDKPLKGARIVGCTHITAQAAVSITNTLYRAIQYRNVQCMCVHNIIHL